MILQAEGGEVFSLVCGGMHTHALFLYYLWGALFFRDFCRSSARDFVILANMSSVDGGLNWYLFTVSFRGICILKWLLLMAVVFICVHKHMIQVFLFICGNVWEWAI